MATVHEIRNGLLACKVEARCEFLKLAAAAAKQNLEIQRGLALSRIEKRRQRMELPPCPPVCDGETIDGEAVQV